MTSVLSYIRMISKLWPELFSESHACVSSYLLDISTWTPNRPPKDTAKAEAHLFFYSSLSPTSSPVSPFCPMSPGSFQYQRSWSFRLATSLSTHLVGFWTLVPSNSSVRVGSLCFLAFQQHTFITSITAASSLGIFPILFFSSCSSSSVRVNFLEGSLTVSVSSSNLFWWIVSWLKRKSTSSFFLSGSWLSLWPHLSLTFHSHYLELFQDTMFLLESWRLLFVCKHLSANVTFRPSFTYS